MFDKFAKFTIDHRHIKYIDGALAADQIHVKYIGGVIVADHRHIKYIDQR